MANTPTFSTASQKAQAICTGTTSRSVLQQTEAKTGIESLEAECEIILCAAQEGIDKVIMTGPQTMTIPLVLFSSQGYAWLLDPDENMALCLMFAGQQQNRTFIDAADGIEIDWDGVFALDGESFSVTTEHALISTRVITATRSMKSAASSTRRNPSTSA